MVCPPAFTAASPVGAKTILFSLYWDTMYLRKVVFPVPAFPVRYISGLSVSSTSFAALKNVVLVGSNLMPETYSFLGVSIMSFIC